MITTQWWVIKSLVSLYPNDADLGAEVRKYVRETESIKTEKQHGKN